MMELDDVVGRLLKKLDDLGIADNTIVVFTTDNGAEIMSLAGRRQHAVPRREGHDLGGRHARARASSAGPASSSPARSINEVMSHEDWMPTLLAAAGDPDVKQKLLKGMTVGDKTFKNHLDGYNFLPFFKGQEAKPPRREIFYFDDNANLNAIRVDDWKISFKIMEGNIANGQLKPVNMPIVINLRQDPFERFYFESQMWFRWAADKLWMFVPAQMVVGPVHPDLQGVSAQPEVRELQRGPGAGGAADGRRRGQQMMSRLTSWRPSCWAASRSPESGIDRAGADGDRRCAVKRRVLMTLAFAVLVTAAVPDVVWGEEPLPSWNDGAAKKADRRLRRQGDDGGLAGLRAGAPSASPCSTTTARCGPSSRCTSRSSSRSTA